MPMRIIACPHCGERMGTELKKSAYVRCLGCQVLFKPPPGVEKKGNLGLKITIVTLVATNLLLLTILMAVLQAIRIFGLMILGVDFFPVFEYLPFLAFGP